MRRLWRLLRAPVLLGTMLYVLAVAAVLWRADLMWQRHGEARSLAEPVDAIIVLASGVDPDGQLGYSTRRRVRAAVAALQAGRARALIMSGGAVTGRPLTGAGLMRDFAVGLGAPAGVIILEDRSRTTFENIRFSFRVAEAAGLERLAILTDSHHLSRAAILAAYFGEPDIDLVAARGLQYQAFAIRAGATLREAAAWWYNAGKIAAWEGLGLIGLSPAERRELVY